MSRAIGEILENAIKFSSRGEAVMIGVEEADGEVRVRITDRGPGIPQSELVTLIGEPRTDRTGLVPSPGLGLFLAHTVVDAHAGQIRVESQVGKGTTFTISLPRA